MLTPQERKACRNRYAASKPKIIKWQVVHFGQVIFENNSPSICESWISKYELNGAIKKPVYGKV